MRPWSGGEEGNYMPENYYYYFFFYARELLTNSRSLGLDVEHALKRGQGDILGGK